MKPLTIVQVGVCEGNDEITDIVKKSEIELLVLVEPLPKEELGECYKDTPNTVLYPVAITPKSTEYKHNFFVHPDGPGCASLSKQHVENHFPHSPEKIKVVEVSCMTMHQIFERHQVTDVDVLFIDAEGYDGDIIASINLKKYNIKRIVFEYINLKSCGILRQVREFLIHHGYTVNFYSDYDIEAIKQ